MTMRINDNGIDRDMTEDEEKTHQIWLDQTIKEQETRTKEKAARAIAKQAVLDKIGITADEAALLFG